MLSFISRKQRSVIGNAIFKERDKMEFKMNYGVWPTMITLFNKDGSLDLDANKEFANRLIEMGSGGIFAVCQSSEMFFLNIEEKLALAKAVKEVTDGRASLVISGHTADTLDEQIADMKKMAEVGADALVLVTNRLASVNEGFDVFTKNTQAILDAIPNVMFGLYECPYPELRLLTDEEIEWCAKTGRIRFLKDVSCNEEVESRRIKIVEGSPLKLYNANTQTLLHSLREGYDGYNGVMGNFHIDIYKWLYENINDDRAVEVQAWLTKTCELEKTLYPTIVKYYLQLKGYNVDVFTRSKDVTLLTDSIKEQVCLLLKEEVALRLKLGLKLAQ